MALAAKFVRGGGFTPRRIVCGRLTSSTRRRSAPMPSWSARRVELAGADAAERLPDGTSSWRGRGCPRTREVTGATFRPTRHRRADSRAPDADTEQARPRVCARAAQGRTHWTPAVRSHHDRELGRAATAYTDAAIDQADRAVEALFNGNDVGEQDMARFAPGLSARRPSSSAKAWVDRRGIWRRRSGCFRPARQL